MRPFGVGLLPHLAQTLEVVGVVDDALNPQARRVGKGHVALRAIHLIAAGDAVDGHAAPGAGATVLQDGLDGLHGAGVALVIRGFEFAARGTEMLETGAALVLGTQETLAFFGGTSGHERPTLRGGWVAAFVVEVPETSQGR